MDRVVRGVLDGIGSLGVPRARGGHGGRGRLMSDPPVHHPGVGGNAGIQVCWLDRPREIASRATSAKT
ncbi:MAG: hypothetical protein NTV23_10405 [Propionibacteriales bacterium]|nr:hypothetical protein [Propionibacteriales bacterium]